MSGHAAARSLQESDAFRERLGRIQESWWRIVHRFALEVVEALGLGIRVDVEGTTPAYVALEEIEQSRSVLSEEVQITFRLTEQLTKITVDDLWVRLCRQENVIVMSQRAQPERRFIFTFTSRSSLNENLSSLRRMLKDLGVKVSCIALAPGNEATSESGARGVGHESYYY